MRVLRRDVSSEASALLEASAAAQWDAFYRRNGGKFFKQRHYLVREFPCLLEPGITLLEARLPHKIVDDVCCLLFCTVICCPAPTAVHCMCQSSATLQGTVPQRTSYCCTS
jgi:hypothetical protein